MRIFLLSNNRELFSSLKLYFEIQGYKLEDELLSPNLGGDDAEFLKEYFSLSNTLRNALYEDRKILVFVDPCSFSKNGECISYITSWNDLEPLSSNSLGALISMLILAYPEVHWIFISLPFFDDDEFERRDLLNRWHFFYPSKDNNTETARQLDEIITASYLGYRPLFDPLGVRNKIRKNIKKPESTSKKLPKRDKVASAIDEEIAYVYFNAYVAYRTGYRSWAISSKKIMSSVFSDSAERNFKNYSFSFEDIYLNFPDRGDDRYSEIRKRDNEIFKKLKELDSRFFITVGHGKGSNKEIRNKNREYFRELRRNGKRVLEIYKPLGGIHELKNRVKLKPPEEFKWPPENDSYSGDISHSSPGRILTISKNLIDRAEKILKDATTVREAITSAMLSLEAKEILVGETPTTALEALAIQHQAEVTAESMFYGVEYNIPLKERFLEIEKEVTKISKWIKKSNRTRSIVNTRLSIAEELAKKFAEMNQFEEEQTALDEARKLRFKFWAMQKPLRWLVYPFLKYIEISLRSITSFFAIVLIWAVLFGVSYYGIAKIANRDDVCPYSFWEAMGSSTVYYFTLQSPQHWTDLITTQCPYKEIEKIEKSKQKWNSFWNFFLAFQGVISLFNLGLFISHIYLIVSRR